MTSFFNEDDLVKTRHAEQAWSAFDPFSINFDEKLYELFTDQELIAATGSVLVCDCEVYCNYFLAAFKCVKTKKVIYFELHQSGELEWKKLYWILTNFCIVGFNSRNYDLWVMMLALKGAPTSKIKELSNQIIFDGMMPQHIGDVWALDLPKQLNHVDLIEVAPLKASLKLYGGRLHARRLQELPIPHDKSLSDIEKKAVKLYCINDLDCTIVLLEELSPHLTLRAQLGMEYKVDLRSKSDAQLAETVINTELQRLKGYWPKKPKIESGARYNYIVPKFLRFETKQLQDVLTAIRMASFTVNDAGSIECPKQIEGLKVKIANAEYRLGIGGLHSSEECIAHKADDSTLLLDRDVASYYPSIIINQGLFPKHLGKAYLTVYKGLVDRRLAAKKAGNKVVNESLKITINGTFGKLGNKWSTLYSPDLLIQVTMTGQLALLMLIEWLVTLNIEVVSANTDGIMIKCLKSDYQKVEACIIHWERQTQFVTEETRYKAIYSRDVNNYIAIKENNEVKVKGAYTEKGSSANSVLSKNPESLVCIDAVINLLTKGIPIEQTINECKDIRRFVTVRTVRGGAEKSGTYIGKVVRWYYSSNVKGTINYVSNGNKVPNSDNAMPVMELPDCLPSDINLDYYIKEAKQILSDIAYYPNRNVIVGKLF